MKQKCCRLGRRLWHRLGQHGGFSLLELLIAIVILGVAVSPLLHAMITSAKTAAKSRSMGNATLAAQNVMESIQAENVSKLLGAKVNDPLFGGTVQTYYQLEGAVHKQRGDSLRYQNLLGDNVSTTVPDLTAGAIHFRLDNLQAAGERFEAEVTFDPKAYEALNYQEVSSFSAMDILFMQPNELSDNPDLAAAAAFAYDAMAEGSAQLGPGIVTFEQYRNYFLNHFSREITLKIALDRRGTVTEDDDVVSLTALYAYKAQYNYSAPVLNEDEDPTGAYVTLTKTTAYNQSYDFPLSAMAGNVKPSIYFFFYPNMTAISEANAFGTGYNDSIRIENYDNVDATVFLIKQDPSYETTDTLGYGLTNAEVSVKESAYQALVSLCEAHATGEMLASVHSNIATRLTGGATPIQVEFRKYHTGSLWHESGTFSGKLVDTVPGIRLYRVHISLYKPGGTDAVYELEGTKLSPSPN